MDQENVVLYTMEFYSAMKKYKIFSFTSKCMELESIILSEVSQAEKTKNHMFSLIADFRSRAKIYQSEENLQNGRNHSNPFI
jgi:hypothetical protein